MVNKKTVIVCTLIAIIVVVLIVGLKVNDLQNVNYAVEEETISNVQDDTKNQSIENEITNQTVENEDVQNDNYVENTSLSENIIGQEESQEITTNNDEMAIKLVQEQWGEDDTVYYTIDKQSGNIYYISVRSKTDTSQLAEYEVDVEELVATLR